MTGHHWQLHPNQATLSFLSAPHHHTTAAPTSWCIRNISTSVLPKPSPEIYLAVEGENEYFTVHLPDQLPTSCCCILRLIGETAHVGGDRKVHGEPSLLSQQKKIVRSCVVNYTDSVEVLYSVGSHF